MATKITDITLQSAELTQLTNAFASAFRNISPTARNVASEKPQPIKVDVTLPPDKEAKKQGVLEQRRNDRMFKDFDSIVGEFRSLSGASDRIVSNIGEHVKLSSSLLNDVINNDPSQQLEAKLPAIFKTAMENSGSILAATIKADGGFDLDAMLNLKDAADSMSEFQNKFAGIPDLSGDLEKTKDFFSNLSSATTNLTEAQKKALGVTDWSASQIEAITRAARRQDSVGEKARESINNQYKRSMDSLRAETGNLSIAIGKTAIMGKEIGKQNPIYTDITSRLKYFGNTVFSANAAIAALILATSQMLSITRKQIQVGGDFSLQGLGENLWTTFKEGVDPQELIQLQTLNRQAFNAMASTVSDSSKLGQTWNAELTKQKDMWINVTGDNTLALQASAAMLRNFSDIGIKNIDELNNMSSSIKGAANPMQGYAQAAATLQHATGYTAEEFNKLQSDMIADESNREIMLKMNKRERVAYLESINNRMAENVALGFTVEQAQKAAKSLAELGAKGPVERFKAAAKAAAIAGAAGVEGAAELGDLLRKRPEERTLDENKRLDELRKTVGDRLVELKQSGLSGEMLASQLEKVMGDAGLAGVMGTEMSSALKDGRTLDQKQAETINRQAAEQLNATSGVATALGELGVITNALTHPLGQIAVAAAGILAAFAPIKALLSAIRNSSTVVPGILRKGFTGLGAAGMADTEGSDKDRKGKKGKKKGKLGKVAKGLGGLALSSIGMLIPGDAMANEQGEPTALGTGMDIAGLTATGASIGAMLGPIGAGVGAALGALWGIFNNIDSVTTYMMELFNWALDSVKPIMTAVTDFGNTISNTVTDILSSAKSFFSWGDDEISQPKIKSVADNRKEVSKLAPTMPETKKPETTIPQPPAITQRNQEQVIQAAFPVKTTTVSTKEAEKDQNKIIDHTMATATEITHLRQQVADLTNLTSQLVEINQQQLAAATNGFSNMKDEITIQTNKLSKVRKGFD